VCELHDCFSANELITYEALGLCDEGKAGDFIDKGYNTYGGRVVVNVFLLNILAIRWIDF
jgi:sterol carrier protein 2